MNQPPHVGSLFGLVWPDDSEISGFGHHILLNLVRDGYSYLIPSWIEFADIQFDVGVLVYFVAGLFGRYDRLGFAESRDARKFPQGAKD